MAAVQAHKTWKSLLSVLTALVLALPAAGADEEAEESFDPLERTYPEIHDTRSGAPPEWPQPVHDSSYYLFAMIDRLEYGNDDGRETQLWDVQAWVGDDYDTLWLKSEGEGPAGEEPESAELQVLYGRTISPFWEFQAGVRYDLRPEPEQAFAVAGLQGLAPYWLETDSALFIGDGGDIRFRTELEYELLFTQRLILQPRAELNAAASDVPEAGIGSGLGSLEAGLRLRYEIRREFAPYVGIRWERKFGETADFARGKGEPVASTSIVLGVRAWF